MAWWLEGWKEVGLGRLEGWRCLVEVVGWLGRLVGSWGEGRCLLGWGGWGVVGSRNGSWSPQSFVPICFVIETIKAVHLGGGWWGGAGESDMRGMAGVGWGTPLFRQVEQGIMQEIWTLMRRQSEMPRSQA